MRTPTMSVAEWQRIDAALDLVLDAPIEARQAALDAACGGEAWLREQVVAMLRSHEAPVPLLDAEAGAVVARLLDDVDEDRRTDRIIGSRIGAWRVVRLVGEGGMSRVFLGEREDGEFTQRVAIKILRAGLDTPSDLARFRAERRILANLDHPGIARLLDGGMTDDGRPYLVLEFIEGSPITQYCDRNALGTTARLELLADVAEALSVAHQQLVVHRDLKPSNILVADDGRPRLLDFGIAKIVDDEDGDAEPMTRRRWYTPEYGAPEQFTGRGVTTATDVYQLGVVLHELLTGVRPTMASLRRGDDVRASSLNRELSRDVDAVLDRALRLHPGERYHTVAQFAAELRRLVRGEAVEARGGDRLYRWRRAARRNAIPLSLAAVVTVALIAYATTVVVQNRRVARALAEANDEREKLEEVTQFLLGLFRTNEPGTSRGDTVSARTLVDRGQARADALVSRPEVQAAMLFTVGSARMDLGEFPSARGVLQRALAIQRRTQGDTHPDIANTLAALGHLERMEGNYDIAEPYFRDALTSSRRRHGDSASFTRQQLFNLASVVHSLGRSAEAMPLFKAWEEGERRFGASGTRTRDDAHRYLLLGDLVLARATFDTATPAAQAIPYFREALAIARALPGSEGADVTGPLRGLAATEVRLGRPAVAESLLREAVDITRRIAPNGHHNSALVLGDLGNLLTRQKRAAEAVPYLREAVAMVTREQKSDNAIVGTFFANFGNALRQAGEYAEAESALREAERQLAVSMGPSNLMTLRVRINLGDVLRARGRPRESEALLLPAFTALHEQRGISNPQTQIALRPLLQLYDETGRRADAARLRGLTKGAN